MTAAQDPATEAAIRSFRDPGGVLMRHGIRILRALNRDGAPKPAKKAPKAKAAVL